MDRHSYDTRVMKTVERRGPDPSILKKNPSCPACAARQMVEEREDDAVYCELCGEEFSWEERLEIHGFK